jgi:hypothetical protein
MRRMNKFGRLFCWLGLHRKEAVFNGWRTDTVDITYAFIVCPRCGRRPAWVAKDEQRRNAEFP